MGLPATMRAAVYRGRGRVEIEERPLPELGARDVLLRVSHCGVCGTDPVPLEGMLDAMRELAAGRIGGKLMVAPGERAPS